MKLYLVLDRCELIDHYESVFHLYVNKEDAIFEAKTQNENKYHPHSFFDVYEIEATKVFDGPQNASLEEAAKLNSEALRA